MSVREGYKQTEIGVIPEEWEVVKLADICDVKGGKRLPKGEKLISIETAHPYIRVSDMYMGGIRVEDIMFVPEEVQPKIKNYTISKNDLFISVAGTLGLVGTVPTKLNGANLTENADKLTNIQADRIYLLYVLMSDLIQNIIKKETTLNAQPKLALTRIKTFLIPFPPLPEQRKIAAILSSVDKKIEAIDERIAKTEKLKKGLMQKLLRDGIGHTEFKESEIGRIPKEWEVVKLDSLAKLVTKGTTPTTLGYSFQENGINFVKVESLDSDGHIDALKFAYISEEANEAMRRSQIEEGDILYSIAGALGRLAIANNSILPANTNQALSIIRLKNKMQNQYIYYFLSSNYIKRHIDRINVQMAQANLSLQNIKNFKIALPPLPEQKQIAKILSNTDNKLDTLREKKTRYEQLKKGLMQKLLTGEVRV